MGKNTKIEWTDHTFNPWIGCTHVSPGCVNCYAENLMDKRMKKVKWGPRRARMRTSAYNWERVVRWNADAGLGLFVECECGHREFRKWDHTLPPGGLACCSSPGCTKLPETECSQARPRVFCASLADWLDPEVPVEWLADLLALIHATPNLDWLLLTKRPERWFARILAACENMIERGMDYGWVESWGAARDSFIAGVAPANVWIGTSVEDQRRADERIPELLKIPARVRFLSCEPLLGPVDLNAVRFMQGTALHVGDEGGWEYTGSKRNMLHWVIAGGESGPNARPMHPDWARSLRDQCVAAGVPFLFKQWGEWKPEPIYDTSGRFHVVQPDGVDRGTPWGGWGKDQPTAVTMERAGKHRSGRLLDGREWNEFPKV